MDVEQAWVCGCVLSYSFHENFSTFLTFEFLLFLSYIYVFDNLELGERKNWFVFFVAEAKKSYFTPISLTLTYGVVFAVHGIW